MLYKIADMKRKKSLKQLWEELEKEIDLDISEDEPLFPIEVVCKMAHLQYWKLRSLLKEGIVKPRKVGRKKMLFSLEDIKKIELVNILMKKEGINIKGIKFILEIEGI